MCDFRRSDEIINSKLCRPVGKVGIFTIEEKTFVKATERFKVCPSDSKKTPGDKFDRLRCVIIEAKLEWPDNIGEKAPKLSREPANWR